MSAEVCRRCGLVITEKTLPMWKGIEPMHWRCLERTADLAEAARTVARECAGMEGKAAIVRVLKAKAAERYQ